MKEPGVRRGASQPPEAYLEVAVAAPLEQTLTYKLPQDQASLAEPGKRVLVPMGRRRVTGYILGPAPKPEGFKARSILDILDELPLFPEAMVPLFRWLADYYLYPLGLTIKESLPSGVNHLELAMVQIAPKGEKALEAGQANSKEQRFLEILLTAGAITQNQLVKKAGKGASVSTILTMQRKGFVEINRVMQKGRVSSKTETYVKALKHKSDAPARQKSRHKVLEVLPKDGEMAMRDLKKEVPSAPRWIWEMEEAGEIQVFEKEVYRDPFGEPIPPDETRFTLTPEQEAAYKEITQALGQGYKSILLHGVTGSGKTEVYLRCVEKALEQGLSVIVLVPEIALISQMQRRFLARFGEKVAVLHSGLSDGERLDQWMRIVRGQAPIALGARSSIFAPVKNLGIVIVDEEHDESYKQDSRLRYQARDLAVMRCHMEKAVTVLGSATPSISSRHNCANGKFQKISIKNRVAERPFPEVTLVDLRNATAGQNRSLLTDVLKHHLSETLAKNEQALLFLNRRGFANFPVCLECGGTITCSHCDVSLTYHQEAGCFQCHYCGFCQDITKGCPSCGSRKLKMMGMGTEKVEDSLREMFPQANIGRLDRDAAAKKGGLVSVLKGLREKTTDIVVGTQMITKGHDFPNITLVGVVCADLSMGFPDFRAGERTFQLLAQVAGRAGRGEKPGRVVLQTYNPEHFCITTACANDYEAFCNEELKFRHQLKYPPFARLAQIRFTGEDVKETGAFANAIGEECRKLLWAEKAFKNSVQVLGPIPSPIARIARMHRWQMLLKGLDHKAFRAYLRQVNRIIQGKAGTKGPTAVIDVDPVNML
ncbi:replication restart DNA helicase PriA [Desulfatibacillum alkenivorans DSM 16219]|uniref:Replication restart protein PriA n=1 Tax=Desulfatibacillum alkenivorans DSM 16219 TaxID=1121393 RepID=A0A1M6GQA1_9BACT|nr:primosomal protein N' [Desulfatibacillum alkenivorans]SHJ12141.1 replication restart DNA helicase PriA [Desulfatibacillum alkenivorans DSM 16219]